MSRFARKKDANHNTLTAVFEALGCRVMDTSRLGGGAPDAIVQFGGMTMLIEIKDGSKPPSARKLTPAEEAAHSKMMIRTVTDQDDVLTAVSTLRKWSQIVMSRMGDKS